MVKAGSAYCSHCGTPGHEAAEADWGGWYEGTAYTQQSQKVRWGRTAVEIYLTQKETEPEEASCPSGLDGGGKGSDRKNAKGAFGKGKGQLMAPDVKDLLHAPKPGSLNAAPKAAGISTGWSSDALLMALLPHLPQDGLPLAIQAQIGTFKQSNTALEGKQLHALVAQKSQAEKEINKIQLQRDKYERGWAQYVAQMSELFMQQLTNRFQIAKARSTTHHRRFARSRANTRWDFGPSMSLHASRKGPCGQVPSLISMLQSVGSHTFMCSFEQYVQRKI